MGPTAKVCEIGMTQIAEPPPNKRCRKITADYRAYRDILDAKWADTGGRCWYCGVAIGKHMGRTLDHVHARVNGGTDGNTNLVACCQECNSLKGRIGVDEFRLLMARRAAKWPTFKPDQWQWLQAHAILPELPAFEFHGERLGLSLPSQGDSQ